MAWQKGLACADINSSLGENMDGTASHPRDKLGSLSAWSLSYRHFWLRGALQDYCAVFTGLLQPRGNCRCLLVLFGKCFILAFLKWLPIPGVKDSAGQLNPTTSRNFCSKSFRNIFKSADTNIQQTNTFGHKLLEQHAFHIKEWESCERNSYLADKKM